MDIIIALIIFVLLTALAVGAALIGATAELVDAARRDERYTQISRWGAYIAFPVSVLGLIASVFHLAVPERFFLGLTQVGSSWISREGAAGIIFAVFSFIYALTWFISNRQRSDSWAAFRRIAAVLAGLAGIVFLLVQASLYAFTQTIPAWNTPLTLALFGATSLAIGSLAVAAALAMGYFANRRTEKRNTYWAALQPFPAIGVISVLALGIVSVLWLVYLGMVPENPALNLAQEIVFSSSLWLTVIAAVVGILIPLVLLVMAWMRVGRSPASAGSLLIISFILVLIGGALERTLFLLSAVHITALGF